MQGLQTAPAQSAIGGPYAGVPPPAVRDPNTPRIFRSNAEVDAAAREKELANQPPPPEIDRLAQYVREKWRAAQDAKLEVEQDLLKDLLQRKGEYDATTKAAFEAEGAGADVFDNVTDTKGSAAEAWIADLILFQPGDRPFKIEATPVSDIPPDVQEQIVNTIMQQAVQVVQSTGVPPNPQAVYEMAKGMRDEVQRRIKAEADKAAIKMETKIADDLAEAEFNKVMGDLLYYFTTYKTAILKGPIVRKRKGITWTRDASGKTVPITQDVLRKEIEAINPFDFYPAPGLVEINDDDCFERIFLSPADLEALRGVDGYDDDEISLVIAEYGQGGLKNWTAIDQLRAELEDKGSDIRNQTKIEALEGSITVYGELLNDWSNSRKYDDTAVYNIVCLLIGTHVVRASPNPDPLGEKCYYAASYRRMAGCFWGKSVPQLMRDKQRMINACARAIVRNFTLASGPQADIDVARLNDPANLTAQYPGKIWLTNSKMHPGQTRDPVNYFQPELHAQELMGARNELARQCDDETGIPPYVYGNDKAAGAGKTMGGLTILMNSASRGIKKAIFNLDVGIIRPLVRKMWLYEMLYNPDESIKGDANIVARGAMALFSKEVVALRRNELLQLTSNPIDMGIIGIGGRAKLLRGAASAAQMDDIVPTDQEIANKERAAQNQPQPQPAPQQPQGVPQ